MNYIEFTVRKITSEGTYEDNPVSVIVPLEKEKELEELLNIWAEREKARRKTECSMCMGAAGGALMFLPMDKKMYAEINKTNAFASKKEEEEYNQANEVYNKKTGEFYRKATKLLLKKGLIEPEDRLCAHCFLIDNGH